MSSEYINPNDLSESMTLVYPKSAIK
jgi:hypothetical protein